MTIKDQVVKNIIRKLLKSEDYRIEIVSLINAEFLQFTVDFFKKIVDAKLKNTSITLEWYKTEFLNPELPAQDIAIHSGLNMKTIHNMYNSSTKEIVIEASLEHYDTLYRTIQDLLDIEQGIDLNLTIQFRGVSIELNVSESLIVINTLAVKRAALRGGLWSTAGKRVEQPLMLTLCKLYNVPEQHYTRSKNNEGVSGFDFEREIDFYLINAGNEYKCEVKLIGRGNPEGADTVIARHSKVFVADKLSETNKSQLNSLEVEWVELRSPLGFKKFETVLDNLRISHGTLPNNTDSKIEAIFEQLFV